MGVVMPRPWGRYAQNFINHPKFIVLSARAICLWLEGKNYADIHLTDGFLPRYAVRTFRFHSPTRVEELQKTVIGHTAPLWESHALGFTMHDYLDYNDSREIVLERIQNANDTAGTRRAGNRDRQARFRANRKQELATLEGKLPRNDSDGLHNVPNGVTSPIPTGTKTTAKILHPARQGEVPAAALSPRKRPIFTGRRLTVFEWQFNDLTKMLEGFLDEFDLHDWFFRLDQRCVDCGEVPPHRDGGAWLKGETLTEAQTRGIPLHRAVSTDKRLGNQTMRLSVAVANIAREAE
jgi:hypothetical protein